MTSWIAMVGGGCVTLPFYLTSQDDLTFIDFFYIINIIILFHIIEIMFLSTFTTLTEYKNTSLE